MTEDCQITKVKKSGRGPGYPKHFIREIVEAIQNGLSRSEVVKRYGLSRSTLSDWMREYGSPAYHSGKQGHLSRQQRSSFVRAILEGRMTIQEAKLAYNISWTPTIRKWLRENEDLVDPNHPAMNGRITSNNTTSNPTKYQNPNPIKLKSLRIW